MTREETPTVGVGRVRTGVWNVKDIRESLFGLLYSPDSITRKTRRDAVKSLMSVLIACRESGIGWDELVEKFRDLGLDMTAATLKTYYKEFRAEAQVNAVTQQIRDLVKVTREKIQADQELTYGIEAHKAAERSARPKPRLVANSDVRHSEDGDETARPRRPRSSSPPPVAPVATATGKMDKPPVSAAAATNGTPDLAKGEAPTLEYVKAHLTEDPEPLRDDVVLKDGRVLYDTGEPFDGRLTSRQVRILEISGRILGEAAKFKGRTHSQVVKLPKEI